MASEAARQELVREFDDALLRGDFKFVDLWFQDAIEDPQRMVELAGPDLSLALAALMVCTGGEQYLPHRQKFYLQLESLLSAKMSEAEVTSHLYGLEVKP